MEGCFRPQIPKFPLNVQEIQDVLSEVNSRRDQERNQQLHLQNPKATSGPALPTLVNVSSIEQRLCIQGSCTAHSDHGRKPLRPRGAIGLALAQGQWKTADLHHNINWLALHAVHLALHHFKSHVSSCHVLALTDNVATKAHINRQGDNHLRALWHEAIRLGNWMERHLLSLRSAHILELANHQADWLSRATVVSGNCILSCSD